MKRFGFHPDQLYFNMRNPTKVKYAYQKNFGNFEYTKSKNTTNLTKIVQNYNNRLEFEKYMNPKGFKPTITSRFPKERVEQDFVSHEMILHRSDKPYKSNQVSFRCNPDLSKAEIKQYLSKIYSLPVLNCDTINKYGEIKRHMIHQNKWRKKDWKKAIMTLDFEVDNIHRQLR